MVYDIEKQYGLWTVLADLGMRNGERYLSCRCTCGRAFDVNFKTLRQGRSRGCVHCRHTTHGCSVRGQLTAEYRTWEGIKQRCYSPNNCNWHKYGAKGVVMCDRWLNSFEAFLEDMGLKPSPRHSIDRYPNQTGNYEPGNCRWATSLEQNANLTRNRMLTYDGETLHASEWARRMGVNVWVVFKRLRMGWSDEKTITTPLKTR